MKKTFSLERFLLTAVFLFAGWSPLSAQVFGEVETPATSAVKAPQERLFNDSWANPRRTAPANDLQGTANAVAVPGQPELNVDKNGTQQAQQAKQSAAEALNRSLAGKRGTSAIRRVVAPGETLPQDESLIFIFYKDFNVSKTMSGMVMCNVRFIVLHTLENKLSNLSFRLKWPAIETTLSYNDAEPNVENYFDYTLVGDGCYSMDKIPNIIVNRCRVKGVTQAECANKIRWLKK